MRSIIYFFAVAAVLFIGCPSQDPQPEDRADWSVSGIGVGQQKGNVILSWTDPQAPSLTDISVTVTDTNGSKVKEQNIKKGVQKAEFQGLESGKTYTFKLSGNGNGKQENEASIVHTVTTINALFQESKVYDLTADFSWIIENLPQDATLKMTADESVVAEIRENECQIEVSPGKDYIFHLIAVNADEEEILASYKAKTLLFWEDFTETGAGVNPDEKKWANPYIDSSCIGGPNEGKESLHGNSAWNNALVPDWSMVEFLEENGTTFMRFKGVKEDGKTKGSGVQSRNHFYFTYGKIEFRARLKENNAQGHFPALWLMPQKSGRSDGLTWPLGGEIDVMEHVRRNSQISQTVHSEKASAPPFYAGDHVYINAKGEQSTIGSYKDWENWHIFAMEWTKDGLFWYLDGKHTRTFNKNMNDPAWYPFSKDSAFYIIMNMGVGRSTDAYPGGAADGFSAHMDVDYVKVIPNSDTIVQDCPYYQK